MTILRRLTRDTRSIREEGFRLGNKWKLPEPFGRVTQWYDYSTQQTGGIASGRDKCHGWLLVVFDSANPMRANRIWALSYCIRITPYLTAIPAYDVDRSFMVT